MGGHKEKSHLDILLDNTQLVLRGTGVDVEPVRLAGSLVLHLAEDTSIRELTLQFRGKAKIPMPATESLVGSATSITYVVCNHDWSFLKGDDRHTKTLKAGQHAFLFHLDITGSLPSTVFTDAFGGASVSYKLRACAIRPGLNHNLNTIAPITIMRSLTNEALEFQQSLEIENTWTGKLMYAIILPHKAWAAGDTISAILKFSPIAKGVAVDHVVTTLCETTKIYARSGTQEDTRILSTAKHDIINGHAVDVRGRPRHHDSQPSPQDNENQEFVTSIHLSVPPSDLHHSSRPSTPSPLFQPGTTPPTVQPENPQPSSSPSTSTPSHALEPINVSHRVRWSIFIRNRDGHMSELRCSLPVTILDTNFLNDALDYSSPSRRILFESSGLAEELVLFGSSHTTSREGQDSGQDLPSYRAHVRDRVPNLSVPWTSGVGTPTSGEFSIPSVPSASRSGRSTPARTPSHPSLATLSMSQLPRVPAAGRSTPLDWVDSELSRLNIDGHQYDYRRSQGSSRNGSGRGSRNPSQNPSPERRPHDEPSSSSSSSIGHDFHGQDRHQHHHHHHHHHRGLGSLFKATIKPFASLASHSHSSAPSSPITSRPPSRGYHQHADALDSAHLHLPTSTTPLVHSPLALSAFSQHGLPPVVSATTHSLDESADALSTVPDYLAAATGSVPPLSSLTDLPSYEEVQRGRGISNSDSGRSCRAGYNSASSLHSIHYSGV